jgi:hypothetical protein
MHDDLTGAVTASGLMLSKEAAIARFSSVAFGAVS